MEGQEITKISHINKKKMEPKHAYKTKLAWYLKTKEIMIILCTKQKRQGTPHGLWLFYEHLGNYSFN